MEKLRDRIRTEYDTFSKGLKKVAKHFLSNPEAFAVNSALQVGQMIEVSETTVIRFCYALGYGGFSAFQRDVQGELLSKNSSLSEYHTMKNGIERDRNFLKETMEKDVALILQTAENQNVEDFKKAVRCLAQSEQILVSGVRSSHAMAHWFSFALDLVRGNVRMFRPDTDDVILRIGELNEASTFVAFSFHRYAIETINLAREAKQKGAFVIGITDSEVAPIKEYSDVLFTVQLPIKSTLDVTPAVFSLMNALIGAVAVEDSERFIRRTNAYEDLPFHHFFAD